MAREARKISSAGMYYVVFRGDELFKSGEDKTVFCQMLDKYFANGEVYGFNLTKTEIRLVVKANENGISMTVKPLTTSYARYFNKKYNLTGKLFFGRFKSEPIESEEEKQEYIKQLAKKTAPKKRDTKINTKGTQKQSVPKETEKAGGNKTEKPPVKKKKNTMPSYLL